MTAIRFVGLIALLLATVVASAGCNAGARPDPRPVVVVGSWTGNERAALETVLAQFTDSSGHQVEYVETRDLDGVINQRLDEQLPLDLAGINGPKHLAELVQEGKVRPLASAIDLGDYKAEVAPTFVELGSVDDRPYGAFIKSSVKGLIWYSPTNFRRGLVTTWEGIQGMSTDSFDSRTRLWCAGLESGEASGWPGTDWIESILIRQSGPDAYDGWVAGRLPWTSQEVTLAFQTFGQVIADDTVQGGVRGAINTNFTAAGDALFTDPPGCLFFLQGSFIVPFLAGEDRVAGSDFDFFPFPQMNPAYDGTLVGGGDLVGLFSDNPAAAELMSYLISIEGQAAWVETGGGALSINAHVDDYPTDVERRAARLLTSARQFRFDASDQMPSAMNQAFMRAVMEFTISQRELPQILNDLDRVRLRAY